MTYENETSFTASACDVEFHTESYKNRSEEDS